MAAMFLEQTRPQSPGGHGRALERVSGHLLTAAGTASPLSKP